MSHAEHLVSAEDLQKLPDDDHRYELVEGRVIRVSPVGWRHGAVVAGLVARCGAGVGPGSGSAYDFGV
ncbi:MAG TPA: Uma2 family endonuclease [Vicinamibacterales bacterium]|jgi:hypothetical protein